MTRLVAKQRQSLWSGNEGCHISLEVSGNVLFFDDGAVNSSVLHKIFIL